MMYSCQSFNIRSPGGIGNAQTRHHHTDATRQIINMRRSMRQQA